MTNMRSKEYPNYAVIVSADEDDRIFSSYTGKIKNLSNLMGERAYKMIKIYHYSY